MSRFQDLSLLPLFAFLAAAGGLGSLLLLVAAGAYRYILQQCQFPQPKILRGEKLQLHEGLMPSQKSKTFWVNFESNDSRLASRQRAVALSYLWKQHLSQEEGATCLQSPSVSHCDCIHVCAFFYLKNTLYP